MKDKFTKLKNRGSSERVFIISYLSFASEPRLALLSNESVHKSGAGISAGSHHSKPGILTSACTGFVAFLCVIHTQSLFWLNPYKNGIILEMQWMREDMYICFNGKVMSTDVMAITIQNVFDIVIKDTQKQRVQLLSLSSHISINVQRSLSF